MYLLPPELRKQLEDLLAAAESGTVASEQKTARAAELSDLLAKLRQLRDPDALKELARAMDANTTTPTEQAAEQMKMLAYRAKRAAERPVVPPEVRKALEDLGFGLSEAAKLEEAAEAAKSADAAASTNVPRSGVGVGQPSESADIQDASIQFSKDGAAGAGAGIVMMSDQGGPMGSGAPGLGPGGGSASKNGSGKMPGFEEALRRETVEASADTPGENVLTEVRRQTEHVQATAAFTRSTSGTFDRSPAAAPPAVPEGRRTNLQSYFIRRP